MTGRERGIIQAQEAEEIRKEEVVDIYAALLDKIWERAQTILGLVTIRAIMRRAIYITAEEYPLIRELSVSEQGLNSNHLRTRMVEREKVDVRQGFEELILNLFDLLAELTGEAIVNRLFADDLSGILSGRGGDA